ncbi:hypothetical protein AB0D86_05295 [Streptomyces sp. NPDC048324]|uniref:hypothetical protein n=1 Tax=Streptomyces sp. NPDC048324 TaxID=3157205 RepID=UPI0034342E06
MALAQVGCSVTVLGRCGRVPTREVEEDGVRTGGIVEIAVVATVGRGFLVPRRS